MPVYCNPREMDAIKVILEEIKKQHTGLEIDQLVEIVASEAECHGIKPMISAPIARQLIEKNGFTVV
jgi:hypothetical protein